MVIRIREYSLQQLLVGVAAYLFCWNVPSCVKAAPPQIAKLSLHGLRSGQSTTVAIEGTDLLPDSRIVLPLRIVSQTTKSAGPNRIEIQIELPAMIPPGMYQLRVANSHGISNAALVGIDALPQVPFTPQITQLPIALHGILGTSTTLQTTFTGKKGQRIVADVEARRLGAVIDPVVELYDSRRGQLAWSQGHAALAGDARLEMMLPADGAYTLEFHDALFRAGSPSHFRLKIGQLHYADLVFPLGVKRGSKTTLQMIGATTTDTTVPHDISMQVDEKVTIGEMPAFLPPSSPLLSQFVGPAPRLVVSDLPEIAQVAPAEGKLQEVTVPAAINGRLSKPNQEGRYRLLVKPDMKLRFDVLANRAGSPLDGVLTLSNEAGTVLAQNDDRPDTVDPGFDYTVPKGTSALVVALKDLQGNGGPSYVYRIAITPADQPDFGLSVFEDRHHLPQGGSTAIRVRANRAGYNGPIKLSMLGLPNGVVVTGDEIPTGATDTLLSLSAKADVSLAQGPLAIFGESVSAQSPIRRVAQVPEASIHKNQPWLRSDLAFAVTQPAPIAIAWDTDVLVLPIGDSYGAKVKVNRAGPTTGPIRLSLLTSQIVPKTPDGKQDDVKRALRLEGVSAIAADQVAGVASILVPSDLPTQLYDLAIRADLTSADGKTVLATAFTPSRRLEARPPFSLQLTGNAVVQAKSGYGPPGKLKGTLTRLPSFKKPVTVSLVGLPAGLPTPTVTIPSERSDFELPVSFPAGTKVGPLPNVKLLATSEVAPKQILKSNEIPLTVQVVPGDPPPQKPLALFEDEQEFVVNLIEGTGNLTREMADKYSGKNSVKVTPDHGAGEKLLGLGITIRPNPSIKIRENPGQGEYRYVRFAWKKKGGQAICLQLNHDGIWGPSAGKPSKFRYHAGPGPESFGASVAVDSKLPTDWVAVTRDLFADFGEFTLTGIALSAVDGEFALFDHIYLGKTVGDFDLVQPNPAR